MGLSIACKLSLVGGVLQVYQEQLHWNCMPCYRTQFCLILHLKYSLRKRKFSLAVGMLLRSRVNYAFRTSGQEKQFYLPDPLLPWQPVLPYALGAVCSWHPHV